MDKTIPLTALFIDIGGVLLNDGWGNVSRKLAAENFNINYDEMEVRHERAFEAYELGDLTIDEYLSRVIFYRERTFSPEQFQEFMFAQSKPFNKMIELIRILKSKYMLKIIVVSNEARELNMYRIKTFGLNSFVDFFVSSSFVHLRKPNAAIFQLAIDGTQTEVSQIIYIENTPEFVNAAEDLGIRSILHTDYVSTVSKLNSFGLEIE